MNAHVLVPIDDSDCSTRALEFALEEYGDARITAVHVIDPGDVYRATGIESGSMANYEQLRKNHEERAEGLLESARRTADDAGVEIETDHVLGGVSRTILEYVEDHDVDHVVVGSHGRTGAGRILMGSVAERIARRSPVPVTIVR